MFFLNKNRMYSYEDVCTENLGFTHVFNIIRVWYFTLIKYFLTTILMKNSAAKLDNNVIPPKQARGRPFSGIWDRGLRQKVVSELCH